MIERWYHWHWDRKVVPDFLLRFEYIVRWRFGWFLTVYKMVDATTDTVEWRFYFPFDVSIGVQCTRRKR